jgi:hypothetical protein
MFIKKITTQEDKEYCNNNNIVVCTYQTIQGEVDGIISDDPRFTNYEEIEVIDNNDIL